MAEMVDLAPGVTECVACGWRGVPLVDGGCPVCSGVREEVDAEWGSLCRRWVVRTARPVVAPRRVATKVGRNAPCPCGSGRKFKVCCGA
jgi:hypothetical protein